MDSLKSQLQALKEAILPGWTWFFDEDNDSISASKGREVRPMFIAHPDIPGYPSPDYRHDALHVVEALNNLPKLVEALERVLVLAEELDGVAGRRQRAAHRARLADRYDLSEAHRQSVKRVRAVKQALIQEITEAFALSPEPPFRISDYYQGSLTDERTSEVGQAETVSSQIKS